MELLFSGKLMWKCSDRNKALSLCKGNTATNTTKYPKITLFLNVSGGSSSD